MRISCVVCNLLEARRIAKWRQWKFMAVLWMNTYFRLSGNAGFVALGACCGERARWWGGPVAGSRRNSTRRLPTLCCGPSGVESPAGA